MDHICLWNWRKGAMYCMCIIYDIEWLNLKLNIIWSWPVESPVMSAADLFFSCLHLIFSIITIQTLCIIVSTFFHHAAKYMYLYHYFFFHISVASSCCIFVAPIGWPLGWKGSSSRGEYCGYTLFEMLVYNDWSSR